MKTGMVLLLALASLAAVGKPLNYDESKVPPYTLEDPLAFADGRKLTDVSEWPARRKEILDIFAREMYGQPPPAPEAVVTELFEEGVTLAGLGVRRQYHMWFKPDKTGPRIDWLVLLPNRITRSKPGKTADGRPAIENGEKCPVILFLNYRGNHELLTDPEIPVQQEWTQSATEIGKLVHDLLCRDAAKMYFDVLRKQVSQFKNSEEGRRYMCKAVEEFAERLAAERIAEGRAEGERKGKRETMLATAKRLLANGKLVLKEIAQCTGLSLAQVKKLQASMA